MSEGRYVKKCDYVAVRHDTGGKLVKNRNPLPPILLHDMFRRSSVRRQMPRSRPVAREGRQEGNRSGCVPLRRGTRGHRVSGMREHCFPFSASMQTRCDNLGVKPCFDRMTDVRTTSV